MMIPNISGPGRTPIACKLQQEIEVGLGVSFKFTRRLDFLITATLPNAALKPIYFPCKKTKKLTSLQCLFWSSALLVEEGQDSWASEV